MSVHGEFERYVRALAEALRATDEPGWIRRADEMEGLGFAANQTLEWRAAAVLDAIQPPGGTPAGEALPDPEPVDRVKAIASIILGR